MTHAPLTCDGLDGELHVDHLRSHEGMNTLPRWELDVIMSKDIAFDPDHVIGGSATLALVDDDDGASRPLALVVTAVEHVYEDAKSRRLRLELAPSAVLLSYRRGYRVFQEKTTRAIVTELLEGAGIPADQVEWRTTGTYKKRNYCVQYRETEWAFVERLLADEGIAYHFDVKDDGTPLLVFSDHAKAYVPIPGSGTVILDTEQSIGRSVRELVWEERLTEEGVHVRDFDVRTPGTYIEGSAGEKGLREYFEYPGFVLDEDAAKARAAVRLEQLTRDKVRVSVVATTTRLAPGRLVHIAGASDESLARDYLVVEARHELKRGSLREEDDPYLCHATLVPWADMAYRPKPPASPPRVSGVEMAITTGPSGSEIHVDDLGRLKVRFPWDRSGIKDDTSSYWVRCLQMNMHSSMLLPRVGWEVPVMYRDGNPDEPVVLGRLYNGAAVTPYALPGAAATSTVQSATSPGGGTTNELRMGDTAGSMEMFLHASKDQTVSVGGSAKTSVSVNETHDIGLSLIATVSSSQTTTIAAKQAVNVGTDHGITVKGARTEMIGGLEAQRVKANRVISIKGAYTELIGGLHGIQANKVVVSVKGAFTHLIGATHDIKGGSGFSETVVAARTEVIGANKSVTSAGAVSDTVTGIKSVTAGTVKEKAGAKISTASKAAGKISVGGSAKMFAKGAIEVEAPSITIEAASLNAESVKLSGGALKVDKGKGKIKGTIKREGGQKTNA